MLQLKTFVLFLQQGLDLHSVAMTQSTHIGDGHMFTISHFSCISTGLIFFDNQVINKSAKLIENFSKNYFSDCLRDFCSLVRNLSSRIRFFTLRSQVSIEENFTYKLQMQQIVLGTDNMFLSTDVVDDDCSRVRCRSAATCQECLFTFFALYA